MIFVNQILQGVLLGGYYALIACGLSFMFGVMGVINLAHGSLAVLSAYALYVLADRFAIEPFLGLLIVAPLMALIGWALQRLVLERSARGGLLVPVLSTFGLSIILDNLLFEGFGADTRSLAPYIGDLSYDSWSLTDDIAIGKLAALTMAVAIALLGGIEAFLNRTLVGRSIRATAEDPDTVGLVGVNARRVNAIAAAIALATVAVAGAFLGMRATFDPYAGAAQLIFAFEASVIGGAGSLWGTLIGGIVLGVAQSLGALDQPAGVLHRRPLRFSRRSVRAAVLRRPRPARPDRARRRGAAMSATNAAVVERWTPESRIAIAAAAIIVAVLAIGPAIFSANAVDKLTTLFIYVILALMWNALVGFCGLVSIGQQAFFGLGAYAAIRLADLGVSVYPSLFIGALIVGALSWPLSIVMLRLKGGEFAIGMWVVSELAHLLVNLDTLVRGETGTSLIELDAYSSGSRRALTYWCALAAMSGLLAIVFWLLRSPLGAAIQAIRDNEEAAESIGVRVARAKRLVFTLAAFGAALAGALWVATALTFQPKAYFSPLWTAYMIFMALVGGLGTFEGAILGAVVFFAIETWFGDMGVWYLVGLGATALIFALLFPRGLWGWVEDSTSLRLLPIGYRLRLAKDVAARRPRTRRGNGTAATVGREAHDALGQDDRHHRNFVRHRRSRRRTRAGARSRYYRRRRQSARTPHGRLHQGRHRLGPERGGDR